MNSRPCIILVTSGLYPDLSGDVRRLAERLKPFGTVIYKLWEDEDAAKAVIAEWENIVGADPSQPPRLVLIGHSFGGNRTVITADELCNSGYPPDNVTLLDPVHFDGESGPFTLNPLVRDAACFVRQNRSVWPPYSVELVGWPNVTLPYGHSEIVNSPEVWEYLTRGAVI